MPQPINLKRSWGSFLASTGSRERPSFMITVDLKAGVHDSDLWVKRGTALLLSLSA